MELKPAASVASRQYPWTNWAKNLRLDGGLPIPVLLVFSIGIIWMAVLAASQLMTVASRTILLPAFVARRPATDNPPVVRATNLKGLEAVNGFRTHLACFSESGKWVYDETPRHLPWNFVGDLHDSTCDARHQLAGSGHVSGDQADGIAMRGAQGHWLVREELKWVWQTNSSCPWYPINRDTFCQQIGSKSHVMVVGDSINQEIGWSLMNALITNGSQYRHLNSSERAMLGLYEMCADIFGDGNGFTVSFVRNDRLSLIANGTEDTVGNFYEYPWVGWLERLGIKLLLLNRGPHYEDDKNFVTALRDTLTWLSQLYPNILVIYRNTQPGHVNCMNFTGPLSTPQEEFPPDWHWGDFHRQNMLAKQIVEEFEYIYMDVYTMLRLRPEGHISAGDCLHYCIPGPLDLAIEYLYNTLLLL